MVRSDRRSEARPQSPSRRSVARPALWLNLVILCAGLAALGGAHMHRRWLDARFERIVQAQVSAPYELAKIRSDLATMAVTREALDEELQARLAMLRGFDAAEFYLAIDTTNRKLRLHFGPEIVRETGVVIGEPRIINADGKTWQKYVILLANGYVIHSPPSSGSPLEGAKPGSFMVAEDQMRAIWPRVSSDTRVYIY